MGTVVIVIAIAAFGCVMFGAGRFSRRGPEVNVVELSDVLKPGVYRTDRQKLQDGVLQLKNEIAASGAVRQRLLENGDMEVSIKVVV